jgi:hypothetical protein
MSIRVASLTACSALLMATAAHAQSAPASSPAGAPVLTPLPSVVSQPKVFLPSTPAPAPTVVAPVTVQAAPGPVAAQKEARDFVQSYAASTAAIDQIARWHTPICISVAGLSDDQAARVASRIREVGEGVGMHALPPGCKANIEVVFTDQPQAFMDKVANTREEILGYYHRHDKDKLKTVTRPVQAWYVTQTASGGSNAGLAFVGLTTSIGAASGMGGGPDGAFVNTGQALTASSSSDNVVDDPDNHGPVGCSEAPQFTHCLTSELNNVLIVIDTSRIQGQKLGPLTDYLSMLALAQVRSLDGCSTLPSVIDRLGTSCNGREAPDGLTAADAAYLTALYTSDLEKNKPLEQDEIASRMSGMLTRPR